ncbi:MAG: hypothetical protein H0T76_15205 [Nannocystis sp.]|nr:hypothetical protein [Nannocystis sp.]MBA3547829.1 hypothetical protein [Nannocystis sp.]
MPREARTIPFTAAQRSTIRVTAMLMLPVGVIMFITSVLKFIELWPMAQMLRLMPLIFGIQWLGALIELAFGICLVVAALALLSVARTGTVDALLRGLRALCVVYVIKAALLLLALAGVLFAIFGIPLMP